MKHSLWKKTLALTLAAALMLPLGIVQADLGAVSDTTGSEESLSENTPPVYFTLGDVNNNNKIDVTDARLTLQRSVGKITLDEEQTLAADVDGNQEISVTDARQILQGAVGKKELPSQIISTHVLPMADMPGIGISTAFAVEFREAGTNSLWSTAKVFSYKSDYFNHMARVKADKPVDIRVTNLYGTIYTYSFVPKRYNITPSISGNTLTFTANPIQKFAIQFSDKNTWLVVVVEPFETDAPNPDDDNVVNIMDFVTDNTGQTDVYEGIDKAIQYLLDTPGKEIIYFPDGIYRTHSIELSLVDNVAFYFSEGARILWDENCWGSNVFRLSGCNNIKFYGRGIIDATYRIHKGRGSSGMGWWDGINLTHLSGRISNGLVVDGLWFFDTPNSPMRTEGGNNALFYNTKYINYGGYQNDNLVIYGGTNVVFDEGIGLGDDDAWSAHTGAWGGFTDTNNVVIRNSTYIADRVPGRGGICYGCNESNPEGGWTWNVVYENLSLVNFGEALDSYNTPTNGYYGNFLFRNVQFETSSSTKTAFDGFTDLSGIIILDRVSFADKGGVIQGNPNNKVKHLYINELYMAGERITSAEQGEFTIVNVENVHWDEPIPENPFDIPEIIPPPDPIPVYSLPISDNFEDNTMMNWTDLSGSQNETCNVKVAKESGVNNYCLQLNDTESSGVAGVIKRFTPQGHGKVVTIEMDIKPTASNKISSVYINNRIGHIVAGVRFYNNGKIKFFGMKGSDFEVGQDLFSYKPQTWYHLKWVIDVSAQRYNLYIGEGKGNVGPLAVGNVPFKCDVSNIASVRLDTESIWLAYAGQTNQFYADNISISSADSDGTLFDPTNTEIIYGDNVAKSQTFNNNDSKIRYVGTWNWAGNRGFGDINDDVHYTMTNGDYVEFTFTGTGIEFITEKNKDQGDMDVYLDGQFVETISCYAPSRLAAQVVYKKTGLTPGQHTIKLVKKSGEYALVDAFTVYE